MPGEALQNTKMLVAETENLSRAQELKWFGDKLGIEGTHMLRLLGYKPETLAKRKTAGEAFVKLAEARPEQTLWITETVRQLLHHSNYDINWIADLIAATPEDEMDTNRKPPPVSRLVRDIQKGGREAEQLLVEYLHRVSANGHQKPRQSA